MRRFRFSLLAAILISLSVLPRPGAAREWTSADGKVIEAELSGYDLDKSEVSIRMQDGREFTLPLERLSQADRDYINQVEAERLAQIEQQKAKAGTTETLTTEGPETVTYYVQYPKSFDGSSPAPLLILFSPGGRGKGILNSFSEAADQMGWIAVGCDGFKNNMDEALGKRMFTELLPHLESNLYYDPEQIYMGGMSGGAFRAYHYSAIFDRPWKGIAACGGWLGGSEFYDLEYPKGMAVAIINGDNDKNANSWVGKDTAVLERRSCDVKTFTFPGGHVVGPTETLLKALQWMGEQSADES